MHINLSDARRFGCLATLVAGSVWIGDSLRSGPEPSAGAEPVAEAPTDAATDPFAQPLSFVPAARTIIAESSAKTSKSDKSAVGKPPEPSRNKRGTTTTLAATTSTSSTTSTSTSSTSSTTTTLPSITTTPSTSVPSSPTPTTDAPGTTTTSTTTVPTPPAVPSSSVEFVGPWGQTYGFAEAAGLTGGSGRPSYVVTSTADSGPGTYREALASGNRYITFHPSLDGAVIRLQSSVRASGSNLTVDGSGVDVTITGSATKFSGTNIVVAGMAFRQMTTTDNEDALTFRDASGTQVFGVYGSTFQTATDGLLDLIWNNGHDVYATICGNEFLDHDKALLVHSGDSSREGGRYHVTLCRNSWDDVYQRAPLSRDAVVHQYNSVFTNYGKPDGAGGGSKSGVENVPSQHLLQNNVAQPRRVGDVTWNGSVVTKPRSEFAGPHASSAGNVRIEGSLLLSNGERTATQAEHNPGSVFTPSYRYPLVPSSTTMRAAVERAAGTCPPSPSVTSVNPCGGITFVSPGDRLVVRTDGQPSSVEVFVDGASIGPAVQSAAGEWSIDVRANVGTVGELRAVATNADGSTVRSTGSVVAVVDSL